MRGFLSKWQRNGACVVGLMEINFPRAYCFWEASDVMANSLTRREPKYANT